MQKAAHREVRVQRSLVAYGCLPRPRNALSSCCPDCFSTSKRLMSTHRLQRGTLTPLRSHIVSIGITDHIATTGVPMTVPMTVPVSIPVAADAVVIFIIA